MDAGMSGSAGKSLRTMGYGVLIAVAIMAVLVILGMLAG